MICFPKLGLFLVRVSEFTYHDGVPDLQRKLVPHQPLLSKSALGGISDNGSSFSFVDMHACVLQGRAEVGEGGLNFFFSFLPGGGFFSIH